MSNTKPTHDPRPRRLALRALMVNNYGEEAALEAAATADEWLAKGNIEAQRVWLRIASNR